MCIYLASQLRLQKPDLFSLNSFALQVIKGLREIRLMKVIYQ